MEQEKNNFIVFHLAKKKASDYKYIAKLEKHIDRDESAKRSYRANIDPSRGHLNQDLIGDSEIGKKQSIVEAIEKRIEYGYKKATPIRKDAVRCFTLHLSASHEIAWDIHNNTTKRSQWIASTKEWIFNTFGKENIVKFTLHADEKTPHFHVIGVPITKDGRLSMKDFVNGKNDLKRLHTEYAKCMEPLGLRRGVENTKYQATTVERFRGQVIERQEEVLKEVKKEISKKILPRTKLNIMEETVKGFIAENERIRQANFRLKKQIEAFHFTVERIDKLNKRQQAQGKTFEAKEKFFKSALLQYEKNLTAGLTESELIVFNDTRRSLIKWVRSSENIKSSKNKDHSKKNID